MNLAAVVLAAGEGSRLGGRCKAALRLPDGRSFLATIVATARAAGITRIVVVAGAPHLEETTALARAADVELVVNPDPARGMASSLVAGLDALDGVDGVGASVPAAFAWPVDHPRVSMATVAALVAQADAARIVIPELDGRGGHPTLFGASLWPALRQAAAQPGGARNVVAADPARVVRVPVSDRGVRLDVDTPADLELAP